MLQSFKAMAADYGSGCSPGQSAALYSIPAVPAKMVLDWPKNDDWAVTSLSRRKNDCEPAQLRASALRLPNFLPRRKPS